MKAITAFFFATVLAGASMAQVGGGAATYGGPGGRARAEANERAKLTVRPDETPPNSTSSFLDARVMINVKADEYVATFGISREGATVKEANNQIDVTIRQFAEGLKQLGVAEADLTTDFVAQNRIYGFEVAATIAKETLTGFEVKKNVSVHYKDKSMLDRFLTLASQTQIFDLIKVDYIVKDIDKVHMRLIEAASKVIKMKIDSRRRLLGINYKPSPQLYAEKYDAYFPTDMYDSYVAAESDSVDSNYRQQYVIQGARKTHTFYFNPLSAKDFDRVVNPVVIEPVVQFTLYLRVKYEADQSAGKPAHH